jgi:hypothetical protein
MVSTDHRTARRTLVFMVLLSTLGGLQLPRVAGAQPSGTAGDRTPAGPWQLNIQLEAVGTTAGGPTGKPGVKVSKRLGAGKAWSQDLIAGDLEDPSLCNLGFVSDAAPGSGRYQWHLETRILSVSAAGASVAVGGRRVEMRGTEQVAERPFARTVFLAPGEYHTIDVVSEADPAAACVNLMVRVSAEPVYVQAAGETLEYDLWLVHRGPPGEGTVHVTITGRSGARLPFQLGPLEWAPPDSAQGSGAAVRLSVTGTITATTRPGEDRVDVTAHAIRRLTYAGHEVVGQGRHEYRASVNKTAALVLPNPAGIIQPPDGRSPLNGAPPLSLNVSELFREGETALYVRVKRPSR